MTVLDDSKTAEQLHGAAPRWSMTCGVNSMRLRAEGIGHCTRQGSDMTFGVDRMASRIMALTSRGRLLR
jgi:hypothetical protein